MKKSTDKPPAKSPKTAPTHGAVDFADIVAHAAQGVLVHRNFKPLYANKAFASLLGYKSPKDVVALPILRPMFAPDLWVRAENDYDDLMKERSDAATLRMPLIRKNGKEIWVSGTQNRVAWQGAPAVMLSVFDVSAQVAAEQAMMNTEHHMRAVLEILPYPIYIARRSDGRLLFVNRKTCLLFERGAGAMLHGTSVDFFADAKERSNLRKLFDTLNDIRDVEVKMKTSLGREFMAELSAIKMDYNGAPCVLVALNDISERKALEAELMHQASTDALTGICNRRYFIAESEQELRRSQRFKRPLSVMMLDVDHFKPINDRHGHAVGDAVLQGVVKRAMESLRQSDQIARLGGEEFAALLPETNLTAAAEVADRLRQHLAERPIIAAHSAVPCTISIGVAQLKEGDSGIDSLLHRADEALYRAKQNGRNRVEVAS